MASRVGAVSSTLPRHFEASSCTTPPRLFLGWEQDHAPLAFRHLREHFGIDEQEYVVAICGEGSLRELGTPGKSGAVFYLTEDNQVCGTVGRRGWRRCNCVSVSHRLRAAVPHQDGLEEGIQVPPPDPTQLLRVRDAQ